MGKYIGSVCRLCRREGEKLFLKGSRCSTHRCAFDRREYAPGQHGQGRRTKMSNYGLQLREKQKKYGSDAMILFSAGISTPKILGI